MNMIDATYNVDSKLDISTDGRKLLEYDCVLNKRNNILFTLFVDVREYDKNSYGTKKVSVLEIQLFIFSRFSCLKIDNGQARVIL